MMTVMMMVMMFCHHDHHAGSWEILMPMAHAGTPYFNVTYKGGLESPSQ
jgi:hypothetical protein